MKLTLNVGSGDRTFDEYPAGYKCINMDNRPNLKRVDVVGDVRKIPFGDEHFDYLLASDIIEHFPIAKTEDLLEEWNRVMKVGAIIEIRTPNIKWVVEHYSEYGDAKFVSYHIFGGQNYSGNFHYVIFDRRWLNTILNRLGFMEIDYEEAGSNFILKAKKVN